MTTPERNNLTICKRHADMYRLFIYTNIKFTHTHIHPLSIPMIYINRFWLCNFIWFVSFIFLISNLVEFFLSRLTTYFLWPLSTYHYYYFCKFSLIKNYCIQWIWFIILMRDTKPYISIQIYKMIFDSDQTNKKKRPHESHKWRGKTKKKTKEKIHVINTTPTTTIITHSIIVRRIVL